MDGKHHPLHVSRVSTSGAAQLPCQVFAGKKGCVPDVESQPQPWADIGSESTNLTLRTDRVTRPISVCA